jgi:hypothetical protein
METGNPRLVRIVSWLSGVVAAIVAISLPSSFFVLSHRHQLEVLDTEAEINARIASQVINANPELWRYQHAKLEEFLARRPRHGEAEARRIFDVDGQVIAQSVDP